MKRKTVSNLAIIALLDYPVIMKPILSLLSMGVSTVGQYPGQQTDDF